ncbi:hypothetical protein PHYPSEUDO_010284 [Phytophthora pseudosyringae]|uniref:Uncharacterized protein n=1 Tax=Phytophthora pseudosyringae TaxID=221518 RepID=A0A8T1VBH1_9STRA|nr:hypothetical protein PHYPSEUDO_010284 [Phytophthora pseudosyringae]
MDSVVVGPPPGPLLPLTPPLFPIGSTIPGVGFDPFNLDASASGWLFPQRHRGDPAPVPGADYLDRLITDPNIAALLATTPWVVLENPEETLTFDLPLHRRAQTALGQIAGAYLDLDRRHLQAFWESTHYLPITADQWADDAVVDQYHQARHHRRILVGEEWRALLRQFPLMMRQQWADRDLLLDPFYLHLPTVHDANIWYPGLTSRAATALIPRDS